MKLNHWISMTEGDSNAFLIIYKSHFQALFSYGVTLTTKKELIKDSIQELFLEIWNKRKSLNKEIENVRSYLFTWLRRKIFHELISLSGKKCTDELITYFSPAQLSYEDLLIAFQQSEERKENLRAALKLLTKKQLEIIRLKFFKKLTYPQIALQTSLTPRSVYNLMYEAIRHLRESMRLLSVLQPI